jgi:hypothetical protein
MKGKWCDIINRTCQEQSSIYVGCSGCEAYQRASANTISAAQVPKTPSKAGALAKKGAAQQNTTSFPNQSILHKSAAPNITMTKRG